MPEEPTGTRSKSTPRRDRLPHGPVTLAELSAGLIWPKLLRTAALALRPSRLILAYAMTLAIAGISDLFVWVMGDAPGARIPKEIAQTGGGGWFWARKEFAAFHWGDIPGHLWNGLISDPIAIAGRSPWSTALYAVMLLIPVAFLGAAISRSTAMEIGPRLDVGAADALLFAVRRWRALFGAHLIPPVFMFAVGAIIAGVGYVLFRFSGISAVTSVLFGALLPLGLVLVLLIACSIIGWLLLTPAVTCDGSDAPDAIQRAYAYVLGRPARLFVYAGILLLQGFIACMVAQWIIGAAFSATDHLATAWLPAEAASLVNDRTAAQIHPAASVVLFWQRALGLVLPAYALSYIFSGSTVLYLLVRRVNDEHDEHDIWLERSTKNAGVPAPSTVAASFE